jgi:3-hydroxyisobutyrate dehydrogenase
MRIGFVGTGTMGTPIAGCLIAAGHQLTICDRRREATRTLEQQGAAVAETPRAAAEASEVVFTSLPGPSESRRRRSMPRPASSRVCRPAAPIST